MHRTFVWLSRIAALAAVVFAVTAAARLLPSPIALQLAFGCAAIALTGHVCLGNMGELAMLREIGKSSQEEREKMHLPCNEATPFGRLLKLIQRAIDKGQDEFVCFDRVDTDICFRKKCAISDLANYTQKDLAVLLRHFEA